MYEFAISGVLNKYGINYRHIFECQKGYRNEIWPVLISDKQMINLTFYKREAGIENRINRADAVCGFLGSLGMPVRERIDNRILQLKSGKSVTCIGIYNYLPGNTIPWEAYTMEHIKTLGAAMSDMHAHLLQMPAINLPSVYDEYLVIISRMQNYFSKTGVQNAMKIKLGIAIDVSRLHQFEKLLKKYSALPNQQPLHMDFVRGNILFDGKKISGILDFEKTALGHCVVDIARTLAFLLVDCKYKTGDKIYRYFLFSGYQKRGQNKGIGYDSDRDEFVEIFLFYDLYKFLLHNPYEFLCSNEHYIRTKDILYRYGMLL